MKSREDFEDELDLKYEMEMAKEKEDPKVGTSAVEKLMEDFDSESQGEDDFLKEENDSLNMYEKDTEYFERDLEDDYSDEKVSFYRDKDNEEVEEVVKYDSKKMRTYFNAVVATLILFLLVVVFLLIMKLSSYEDKTLADQQGVVNEQLENEENVKKLQDENTSLNNEVTSLKNEIQNLMVDSGANVEENQNNGDGQNVAENVAAPIEIIPEPKVPLAPPPAPVDNGVLNADVIHTVVKGDTLTKLARIYYGDQTLYTKIKEANGLTSDEIVLGTDIIIPKQY